MKKLSEGFKIGDVFIPSRVVLGPMAGVTDLPFRLLCREMGVGLAYTEMISAKGIFYNNKNTELLWATNEKDSVLALQLFGSDADLMSDIAKRIEGLDFDILDINMGCPVPKVVNNHEGSALMKNPELAAEIVSKIKSKIKKPVTVKFRKGFDKNVLNAVSFAKLMEEAGADSICVHGRTREEYYRGEADWDIIKEVKSEVKIPVIASGDIFNHEDALKCMLHTDCDAIMVARGARGNPWIFKNIKDCFEAYDEGREAEIITKKDIPIDELKSLILRHAKMLIDFKGEFTGIREMRKHFSWYTLNLKGGSQLRRRINEVESLEEIEAILESLNTD